MTRRQTGRTRRALLMGVAIITSGIIRRGKTSRIHKCALFPRRFWCQLSLQKTSVALWASILVFCLLVAIWFVPNHYRVVYYNDAFEWPSPHTSPYWTIIHVQDRLLWAIRVVAFCSAGLMLFRIAQWVGRVIAACFYLLAIWASSENDPDDLEEPARWGL